MAFLEILFGGANHLAPWHLEWVLQKLDKID